MTLEPGFILRDRYRIESQLGRGGMGTVYLATDLTLQIQVAVKENLNVDPVTERQFRREASLLATLRHTNLPRVTDHFILEGRQYLAMDYIEGEDLEMRCARQPPTVDEVLYWSETLFDAMIYLHSREPPVIHRDIKPANIKLQPDGNLMLVDFGIAKIFDSTQTATGARGLTPGFSPPEQYGGAHTDHRSDQYSLGATLYTILTGERPADSIERLFQKKPLAPPRDHHPEIPAHVDAAIRRSLALNPEDRFPDMVHFRAALRGESQPVTVRRSLPPSMDSSKEGERSNKWPLWGGIFGGAIVLGLVAFLVLGGPSVLGTSTQPSPTATLPIVALAPTETPSPTVTSTTEPTSTLTASPIPSPTVTPSATPTSTLTPIPLGGGGLIAFVSDRGPDELLQVWTMSPDGTNARQLTFGPGDKAQPRWSPDGKRIAYVSSHEGNQEIYLMNADGSHIVNLTNNEYEDYEPAWSPDGKSLAFTTTRYIGQTQIYIVDVYCASLEEDCEASEARSLSRGYADESFATWAPAGKDMPTWMPGDQPLAVAISINFAPNRIFFRSESHGNPPVWLDVQDRVMSAHDLRWTPDGQFLLFTWKLPGKFEIYALPIAERGNSWTKLTNSLGNKEPAPSPDGQYIIFTSTRDQDPEIYRMTITGAEQINLTNRVGRDLNPDWQPLPAD